jgi:hypothetical protein
MAKVRVVVEVEFEDGTENIEQVAVDYVNEAIGTGLDLMSEYDSPELLFMQVLDEVLPEGELK